MPQYMLLIYVDPATRPEPGSDEERRNADIYNALTQDLRDRGMWLAGARLQPTDTATSVRVNGTGEAVLSDGPFAETKEWLAGYYLLECPDLDTATEQAARVPATRFGTVEVRPIWEMPAQ